MWNNITVKNNCNIKKHEENVNKRINEILLAFPLTKRTDHANTLCENHDDFRTNDLPSCNKCLKIEIKKLKTKITQKDKIINGIPLGILRKNKKDKLNAIRQIEKVLGDI